MDYSLLGFSGLKEFFNLHPMFVHFPIALIPSALLLYGLGIAFRNRALNIAGRACLNLAAAGTTVAVATGLHAMETFPHNDTIHHMALTHRTIALAVMVTLGVLFLWSFWQTDQRPRAAWAFLVVLAFATIAVLQAADIGARMVFVQGAAVRPAVSVIAPPDEIKEFEEHHRAE